MEEKSEKRQQLREHGKKPENQNQSHNSVREGMGPNTVRKPR